jgi:hypothetical protein
MAEKSKSPNAGKEVGRLKTGWGKGKRAVEIEVIMRVSDEPVPMEQVRAQFAKLISPVLRDLLEKDTKEKAERDKANTESGLRE